MLATTATASATRATQPSAPRDNSSMLMAEISSKASRTRADTAAPARTASAARPARTPYGCGPPTSGQHHIGVWPVQFPAGASASLLAASSTLLDH